MCRIRFDANGDDAMRFEMVSEMMMLSFVNVVAFLALRCAPVAPLHAMRCRVMVYFPTRAPRARSVARICMLCDMLACDAHLTPDVLSRVKRRLVILFDLLQPPRKRVASMSCARCPHSIKCAYDRPLPARRSSLIPIAGILLNRRLDFVDEVGDDV